MHAGDAGRVRRASPGGRAAGRLTQPRGRSRLTSVSRNAKVVILSTLHLLSTHLSISASPPRAVDSAPGPPQVVVTSRAAYVSQEIYGEEDEEAGDSEECVICFCEPKDTTLLPCRHLCVCRECFARLENCPVRALTRGCGPRAVLPGADRALPAAWCSLGALRGHVSPSNWGGEMRT
jgi:hypothetical protein